MYKRSRSDKFRKKLKFLEDLSEALIISRRVFKKSVEGLVVRGSYSSHAMPKKESHAQGGASKSLLKDGWAGVNGTSTL